MCLLHSTATVCVQGPGIGLLLLSNNTHILLCKAQSKQRHGTKVCS